MKLGTYIRAKRKELFQSAADFIKKQNLDIPLPTYYGIEQDKFTPSPKDLYKVIVDLKLNPKITYLLWLLDQLPDESLKSYFPVPSLDTEDYEEHVLFNPDQMQSISKSHIDYFIRNRLARILLMYTFTNSVDSIELEEYYSDFSKHSKATIRKELKNLVEKGYIYEPKPNYFKSNMRYLYIPKIPEFLNLHKEVAKDIIDKGNWSEPVHGQFGQYNKGYCNFQLRTLSREQFDFMKEILIQAFEESKRLENKAGQEFFILINIGALNEK